MRIRKYKTVDNCECVKLITDSLGKSCGRLSKEHLSARIGSKPEDYSFCRWLVAVENKKIIGICGVYRTNSTPQGFWGIDWFAVDKKYRKKGVGKTLLLAITKGIKGKIFVWATKRAMKFYAKAGFKFLEPESDYLMVR